MQIAKRKPSAALGRYCAICGYGMNHRKGGLDAAGPKLRAMGYEVLNPTTTYAHTKCLFNSGAKKK